MRQSAKRFIGVFLALVMTVVLFGATGIDSQAATKKLSTPDNFNYLWSGDYLAIKWTPVKNAEKYELVYNGVTVNVMNNLMVFSKDDLTLSKGKYPITFKLRAVPSKKSSYTASDYVKVSDNIPAVSYKDVTSYSSAASLSKTDLLKWLGAQGFKKYTETEEDGYTVITVSCDDSNNGDDWFETQIAGAEGEIDSFSEGDAIGGIISGIATLFGDEDAWDEYQSYIDEKYSAINEQARNDYKKTDKKIYYKYYFTEGLEDYGAEFFSMSYLQRNNPAPKDVFTNWSYDKNSDCTYFADELFRDYKLLEYGQTGSGTGKRYLAVVQVYRPM